MSGYPALTPTLHAQLRAILPSRDGGIEYYPCAVTLDDGRALPRVYVVEFASYIRIWGMVPEADPGKRSVLIERVDCPLT